MAGPAAEDFKDLGFGTSLGRRAQRLITREGSLNVRRRGAGLKDLHLYQFLLGLSWLRFWGVVLLSFFLLNLLFASLYVLMGVEQLAGYPEKGSGLHHLAYAFYFSVQTFTTVGYGVISPSGHPAHLLASLEAMTGLIAFAFAASVLYGRFARPTARILYSEKALFAPYQNGQNAWMIRIVNGRPNPLIELEAKVILSWFPDGDLEKRRFTPLPLERGSVALFPLSWTLVHPITAESPLYGLSPEAFSALNPEFLVLIKGYDDTFAQEVHSRCSYMAEDCVWGARFNPMFYANEEGEMVLEMKKLGEYREAELNG